MFSWGQPQQPPPQQTADPDEIDHEWVAVFSWRLKQLVNTGSFDSSYAGMLASLPHLDWRKANAMHAAGCPQKLVWKLLRDD